MKTIHSEAHRFISTLTDNNFLMSTGFGLGIVLAMEHPELAQALFKGIKTHPPGFVEKHPNMERTIYDLSKDIMDKFLERNALEMMDD